jgi:outer membrane protein
MLRALLIVALAAGVASAQEEGEGGGDLSADLGRLVGVAGGFTSDKAAARARRIDPAVAARAAQVAEAEAERSRTRLGFLPGVRLVARYTRLSPVDDTVLTIEGAPVAVTLPGPLEEQTWVGAEARVPLSDYVLRLGRASAARTGSLRSARWMEKAEARQAAAAARRAYYDWARARLGVRVAEKGLEQAETHQRVVARRAETAAATKADLLVADSRVAQAERTLTQASGTAALAERRLRIATGIEGELAIGEDVLEPLGRKVPRRPDRLIARAGSRRPELRALDGAADALDAQASLEAAAYLPRLDLAGSAARARPHPRQFPQEDRTQTVWDVSVVLSFPLEGAAVARAARQAISARQAGLAAERRRVENGIELEVSAALDRLHRAEAAIRAARRVLDAAEEVHRVRTRLYRAGSATVSEVDDADAELTRARFAWIDAHIDLRVAWVDVDLATGR